jgi:NADPH-dependent curcumin reductase
MTSTPLLTKIVLARHIEGTPSVNDFRVEQVAMPELADGQLLIAHHWVSADPGTRSRLSGQASYAGALGLGEVVDGFAVGTVVASRNPRWAEGSKVVTGGGWASHSISNGRGFIAPVTRNNVDLHHWISALGVPGMTAWFGLKRVGSFKAGDRVLVTSAAGPVGATAGQLAKAWAAERVVGVASSGEKADWLTNSAGLDAVIDWRANDFDTQVAAAIPDGIDLLFDNVGNAMIDRLLPLMRPGGRIVVSGQVADYNTPVSQRVGITNTDRFITHRLRMEGLVVFDDMRSFSEAQNSMADMIAAGQLATREVIGDGVESLPELFCGLFGSSAAFGRRLARISSP